eukprot:TRINITY_DN64502_c0_g1_i1.p1 TRINITY_DN64502_c0_g1~~TRINITY_DN64502_c0_g1_i1.p1  ORF type:complete len:562 (+),score=76.18 TRINITY_DN64502_c0_g1_i1:21-1706(+)
MRYLANVPCLLHQHEDRACLCCLKFNSDTIGDVWSEPRGARSRPSSGRSSRSSSRSPSRPGSANSSPQHARGRSEGTAVVLGGINSPCKAMTPPGTPLVHTWSSGWGPASPLVPLEKRAAPHARSITPDSSRPNSGGSSQINHAQLLTALERGTATFTPPPRATTPPPPQPLLKDTTRQQQQRLQPKTPSPLIPSSASASALPVVPTSNANGPLGTPSPSLGNLDFNSLPAQRPHTTCGFYQQQNHLRRNAERFNKKQEQKAAEVQQAFTKGGSRPVTHHGGDGSQQRRKPIAEPLEARPDLKHFVSPLRPTKLAEHEPHPLLHRKYCIPDQVVPEGAKQRADKLRKEKRAAQVEDWYTFQMAKQRCKNSQADAKAALLEALATTAPNTTNTNTRSANTNNSTVAAVPTALFGPTSSWQEVKPTTADGSLLVGVDDLLGTTTTTDMTVNGTNKTPSNSRPWTSKLDKLVEELDDDVAARRKLWDVSAPGYRPNDGTASVVVAKKLPVPRMSAKMAEMMDEFQAATKKHNNKNAREGVVVWGFAKPRVEPSASSKGRRAVTR